MFPIGQMGQRSIGRGMSFGVGFEKGLESAQASRCDLHCLKTEARYLNYQKRHCCSGVEIRALERFTFQYLSTLGFSMWLQISCEFSVQAVLTVIQNVFRDPGGLNELIRMLHFSVGQAVRWGAGWDHVSGMYLIASETYPSLGRLRRSATG